jgi:hypothetical protein
MELTELDDSAFKDLRRHLLISKPGHYGLVRLANGTIDLSKRSWLDPEMYHHLMVFARLVVPIPFTSVYIGPDLKRIKRSGRMYLVSFGFHTEGELVVGSKTFITNRRPIVIDDTARYTPQPFVGIRNYLCYYSVCSDPTAPQKTLDSYEAVYKDFKYRIACYADGEATRYVSKDEPLWKPTKRSKTVFAPTDSFVPNMAFTPAQNLLLRVQQEKTNSDEDHNEP